MKKFDNNDNIVEDILNEAFKKSYMLTVAQEELYEEQKKNMLLEQDLHKLDTEIENKENSLKAKDASIFNLQQDLNETLEELEQIRSAYCSIREAFFWRITKPMRMIANMIQVKTKKSNIINVKFEESLINQDATVVEDGGLDELIHGGEKYRYGYKHNLPKISMKNIIKYSVYNVI